MPALFSATLLCSAFLLFLVQPLFARMVLPLLGGSPAVWNACMLFFQAALLLGYGYSHATSQRLQPRAQAVLHLCLLCLPLLALPLALPPGWAPPPDRHPVPSLLLIMLSTVGPPFVLVATSAPLLQRWFSRSGHERAADPYFLYAASNIGSLAALLSYPLLMEPRLTLAAQGRLWAAGYALLMALTLTCALAALRRTAGSGDGQAQAGPDEPPPTWRRRARWVALATGPSSLMLGATTYVTTDLAAVPLLWVAPLSFYLLSFVIAFARRPVVPHALVRRVFPVAVVLMLLSLLCEISKPVSLIVGAHVLFVGVVALYCHGELAADRPAARHLTDFYLWLSVGGVLGGCFNALAAPLLFKEITEYPAAIVLVCLLQRSDGRRPGARDLLLPLGLGLAYFGLRYGMAYREWIENVDWRRRVSAALGLPLLLWPRRPLRLALGAFALLLAQDRWLEHDEVSLFQGRSFFGSYRVRVDEGLHLLLHGTTRHGAQHIKAERRGEPLTYYHRKSPIADLITRRATPGRRNAVVGLGAGTLAAYMRAGQVMRFYEIDPLVRWIADGSGHFTYVGDARARGAAIDVALGDARLSLAGAADGEYDLLALDAFSSDAIPLHLLTREAILLYARKLAPGGVLAVHITNRYVALLPVLADLAAATGMAGRSRHDRLEDDDEIPGVYTSHWVALTRTAADLAFLDGDRRWRSLPAASGRRPWTDDYSNLVGALR